MKTLQKVIVMLALPLLYFLVTAAFKSPEMFKSPEVLKTASVTNIVTTNASNPPVIVQEPKDFRHFILNFGYFNNPTDWEITNFWDYYRGVLSYNAIQMYDYGSTRTGTFDNPLSQAQIDTVNVLINTALAKGLKPVYQRTKISEICQHGFRLVYEAEGLNDGYSFEQRITTPVTDNGRTVVRACNTCGEDSPSAGYLCRNITENIQPCAMFTYPWDPGQNWHLKPEMRIDSAIVDIHPDWPVVAIVSVNFSGQRIDSTVIKARNFAYFDVGTGTYIYDGSYKYEFDFTQEPLGTDLEISGSRTSPDGLMYGFDPELINMQASQINFKIYWFGQVDVWFDKMTLDNDIANKLFKPFPNNLDDKLEEELTHFADRMDIFFVDECLYANLPCIKYVQDYIRAYNQQNNTDAKLSYAGTFWLNGNYGRLHENRFKMYLDITKPQIFQIDAHPFVFDDYTGQGGRPGYIPFNVFDPAKLHSGILDNWKTTNNNTYNTYLQNSLGKKDEQISNYQETGSLVYQINQCRNQLAANSPETRFTIQPQIQGWLIGNENTGKFRYGCREPLNEEISAEAWIALAYGADNLNWFWLPSWGLGIGPPPSSNIPKVVQSNGDAIPGDIYCSYGVFTTPAQPRTQNLYGQNKFDYLCTLNAKILSLKPTLDVLSWDSAFSVHSEGANHGYIQDIMSILPGLNGQNPCVEDHPNGPYMDCTDERYWEMGFYNDLNGAKYFTMVNRRCIPESENPNYQYSGDNRVLRIKFDLTGPINWQISEVGSSVRPKVFDRTKYASFGENPGEMGWFKPGEGKLFKIEPAINSGGELVEDEFISGGEFTCQAPVYNNGHNITIGANTTIHFNDSSKFVMSGGVFTVGDQNTSAPQNITSDAVPGGSWSGHSFTNCEVKIYGATFTGLTNDTTYAVNIIDCPVVDIRNCTFNTNSSLKGGINAVFFSDPNNEITLSNIYIGANTFNSSGSTIPTINISSYAGETTPLIIENITFNEGNTAIFLSGITGGAIKGNTITDNFIGINALTSAIDIKSNTISSTINSAIGIFAAGGSELKMNNAGSKSLGGLNDLSNTGSAANNIVVDGSVFLLDGGQNIFNITDDQTSKHLYGYFPQFTQGPFDETNNCFKLNSSPVDPPHNMVTSGFQGSQITFNFTPYLTGCDPNQSGDGFAINLGDGIYDTIYSEGSGSGGSHSSRLPLAKGEYPQGEGVYYKQAQIPPRWDFEMTSSFLEYDSISVLMRYRNYSQAKTKCLELINAYPDSIQSLNAISKLFLSTVASDTSYNAVNELKLYYEDLILNHGYNTSLVKRANYYILKCKVRMRVYSQALAGFQQIINQNPYSYEGLIARWDYMATSLLIQGQGGGEPSITNYELGITNNSEDGIDVGQRHAFDYSEIDGNDDDRSPFTKEQRQDIRKSINTAIEISKDEDDRKIKTLEVKSEQGDVNASKELEQIRSLKQVVKAEKPKSIIEHVRIVSEDIRKVFGSNTSSKGNEPRNIPMVFRLSQNYPNPFNPVTKINYDLPKDSKVKIVIYDILGREVKRLVNNELKTAGSYIVDFNAMNYASGVYFYRIEAEEPNGNKSVDSKKMVLLK